MAILCKFGRTDLETWFWCLNQNWQRTNSNKKIWGRGTICRRKTWQFSTHGDRSCRFALGTQLFSCASTYFPNRVAIAVGNREAILVVNLHFCHIVHANRPFVLTIWEYASCVIFSYRGACKLSGVWCLVSGGYRSQFSTESAQTLQLASPLGWAEAFFWIFRKNIFWLF